MIIPTATSLRLLGGLMVLAALTAAAVWMRAPARDVGALIDDDAGLLTAAQQQAIARYHRYLLDTHDIDYRVVTARNVDDLNRAAVARFRDLGRHSRSRSGRGLLLLIDPAADQVRLEVGYPLEGAVPDAFVDYVERQQMVPFFRMNRVADGIVATTELIVARVQGGDLGTAAEAWSASSGGAGATADAHLGAGTAPASASSTALQAGSSPETTLAAYVEAMAAHDANPALSIYTPDTRRMLRDWLVTPAQMDNVVRSYRDCEPGAAVVSRERRAVVRFSPARRGCAPYFFERIDGRWRLDLTTMQRAIRFGAANAWHFAPNVRHPYAFAFEDWQIDRHGYPRAAPPEPP